MRRPEPEEYGAYYQKYIDLTRGSNSVHNLEDSASTLIRLLEEIPESKRDFSYAPGKWTVHQVLQHIVDCDMVFSYRALWIARGGEKNLPSFEQDDWAKASLNVLTPWDELLGQFKDLRNYTISLFKSFSEEIMEESATVSGYETKVRSIGFIISGHTFHHIEILKNRYL